MTSYPEITVEYAWYGIVMCCYIKYYKKSVDAGKYDASYTATYQLY